MFFFTDVGLSETRMTVCRNLSAKSADIGGVKSSKINHIRLLLTKQNLTFIR
jgi:hypothetical protein